MESKLNVFSPETMTEILALLDDVDAVPLVISGNSMTPFLVHGRDSVYISKIDRKLKRGDVILYKRDSGDYILHRIYRVQNDCYDMIGDARRIVEAGIRNDQVLAVAVAARRKGKLIKKSDPVWLFFEKIWIRMVPIRPKIAAVCAGLKRFAGR